MRYKDIIRSYWIYTMLFAIVCIIGYSPFWLHGISLIWEIDGIGQYYPAFLYIGQYIREYMRNCLRGDFAMPLFDISIGMGDDVIGVLNYYGFGDPLNFIAVFATKSNGAYIFAFMYFLRLYLAGACLKIYCRYMKLDDKLSSMGALCYAFCGFAIIGGARYSQFLSSMIYLPLILLGCEKIIKEKKIFLFAFSIAYASVCNFYFMYMASIFMAAYFVFRSIAVHGIKNVFPVLKDMLLCAAGYVFGIMLSAPIIFPAISALLNSERVPADIKGILFNPKNYEFSIEALKDYITDGLKISASGNYWTGLPLLQCLCLAASVFSWKTKRDRQCAIAAAMGTFFWCMPITGIIFSAFGTVYTRWVFLLYFSYAIVFICFSEKILRSRPRLKNCFLAAVAANIAVNLLLLYGGKVNWKEQFVSLSKVQEHVASPVANSDIMKTDAGMYRVGNDMFTDINGRPDNIAMINGYNGLNFWFSVVNGNTQKMVNQLGTEKTTKWRSYGLNNISLYETLAGVKYYAKRADDVEKLGYDYLESMQFGNEEWKIYKNEYALPLAYTYKKCISNQEFDALDIIGKIDAVSRYAVLGDTGEGYDGNLDIVCELGVLPADREVIVENIAEDDEIYLKIPANNLNGRTRGFAMSNKEDIFYAGRADKDIIHNLGTGHSGRLRLFLESGELSESEAAKVLSQIKIYKIDGKEYKKIIDERNELKDSEIKMTKNKIEIENVKANGDRWMVLAIPYSDNWKCYADGEKVKVYKCNTLYMAVEIDEGVHKITFKYINVPFYAGIVLFLASGGVMIVRCNILMNTKIFQFPQST